MKNCGDRIITVMDCWNGGGGCWGGQEGVGEGREMEGVEGGQRSSPPPWESGWEQTGREVGAGRECGHLGHRAWVGSGDTQGGGDEQTFGRSWGESGTPANKPANPISIHRDGGSVLSSRRVGARGSRGCLHLLRHLHSQALPHCAQVRPTEGALPGWEGAVGVASPDRMFVPRTSLSRDLVTS